MCRGTLRRGIDVVLEAIVFDERCAAASLVLTGEGRLDAQSLRGKACMGVAAAAARLGKPTIAIVGSIGEGAEECSDPDAGGMLSDYVSLEREYGRERALREPGELIRRITERVVRELVSKRGG